MTRPRRNPCNLTSGLSLAELLCVMAIIALLVTAAIPSWQRTLVKQRRMQAVSALLTLASQQEAFRLANGRYAGASELEPAPPAGLGFSGLSDYEVTNRTHATGFLLSASPYTGARQSKDAECWLFTLDGSGRQAAQSESGADNTARCWPS